jgi:UDP-N-acetylglucosamine--N-acetylmuramyl-(pentapeptide) pyrophosphoryl-undecaprenol N-acetylglucosamine transferase
MGGSLGARLINKTVPKVFSKLAQVFPDFKFVLSHQCGKGNLEETKSYYDPYKTKFDLKLFEFEESMESFYSNADLIISRAGALSVSEICETQNIAIFIPLKNSIDNHQYENAKFLVEKNSAFICEEYLLEENLKKLLFEIVKTPEILEDMKKNISKVSLTDQKNIIVKKILSNE